MDTNLTIFPIDYYPQKIIFWMKSYNIPYKINRLEDGKYSMSIEEFSPNIQMDSVNECVFLTFLMWTGNHYQFKNEVLKQLENNATNNS